MKSLLGLVAALAIATVATVSSAQYIQSGTYMNRGAYEHIQYPVYGGYSVVPSYYYVPSVSTYAPPSISNYATGPYRWFETTGSHSQGVHNGFSSSVERHGWRTYGYSGPFGHGGGWDESHSSQFRGYGR